MPTVLHRLARWAQTDPDAPAQRFKRDGAWQTITARQFAERVHHLALFLESRGITAADAGCIMSPNSAPWVHLDLALLLIGAKSAGMYPNSTGKDLLYILGHTEARVLGVKDREFFEKVADEQGKPALPPRVELVIAFEGGADFSPKAVTYEAALEEGRKIAAGGGSKARTMTDYLAKIDPKAGSILIYTSGTTGNPKGALLSHDNLAYTSDLAIKWWKLPFANGSLFSFLPLCHIAEKLQCVGVGISQRYAVSFCTKFDLLMQELPEAQPTLLLCVPRLWEKMMEGVVHKVSRGTGLKKKLAEWALDTGARVAEAKFSGGIASPLDLVQLALAEKLVLSKIKAALGLGRAELLASGAAPLPAHVSKWFRSLGLEILEDFGQTESTGVICMTESGVESAGTVGKPVTGIAVKLAPDGEILCQGRNVFVGYFKNDQATAETLIDGWLHTGDLGEIDARGLMRIRGRKKEIMKTSGGKMVAPLPIEETLKTHPLVSQACMVGDNRKYMSVLITLAEGALADLKARRPDALSGATVADDATLAAVKSAVDAANAKLASYEQIKRFAVLSREFSIVDGEMTPTLKMKRAVIERNFRAVIDSLYSE